MATKNSCIKNYFNVNLNFTDCQHIQLQDTSEWMQGDAYVIPDEYEVSLTMESWRKTIKRNISAKKVALFSAQEFDLESFGDDILCITVDSCGVKYTKKKALLCGLECKVMSLLAQAKGDEDFNTANHLLLQLESIKINVELDRISIAEDLLEAVKKQLKKYNCDDYSHCGC
jgi:hypothetical protein